MRRYVEMELTRTVIVEVTVDAGGYTVERAEWAGPPALTDEDREAAVELAADLDADGPEVSHG